MTYHTINRKQLSTFLCYKQKIICKSLDYYKELYYNQGKNSSKDVIWLSLLGANNFSELEEMASLVMNEKEKNKFVDECKDSSKNTKWLSE